MYLLGLLTRNISPLIVLLCPLSNSCFFSYFFIIIFLVLSLQGWPKKKHSEGKWKQSDFSCMNCYGENYSAFLFLSFLGEREGVETWIQQNHLDNQYIYPSVVYNANCVCPHNSVFKVRSAVSFCMIFGETLS